MDHLLPSEVKPSNYDVKILTPTSEITHKGFRKLSASMVQYLGAVNDLAAPDFSCLIKRYCEDLDLPSKNNYSILYKNCKK